VLGLATDTIVTNTLLGGLTDVREELPLGGAVITDDITTFHAVLLPLEQGEFLLADGWMIGGGGGGRKGCQCDDCLE